MKYFNRQENRRVRSLDGLVMPRRPSGIPYPEGDDFDAQALLVANGYTTETEELTGLLDSELAVFQAAAARLLGARKELTTIEALERLAHENMAEETVRVQAAFALARMDVAGARDILIKLLKLPPEASPAPLHVAGVLARLGDPQGFPMVRQALNSPNPVTAMIACKQLYAFVPLDGRRMPGGGVVDVFSAFEQALERPEPNIAGEARAQLKALDTERAREVLAAHRPRS